MRFCGTLSKTQGGSLLPIHGNTAMLGRGKNIMSMLLLVEDEAIVALGEKRILERNGFEVLTAHSGEKAISLVAENPDIDLILMDIDLGEGIDGPEAAQRIRAAHDIPIVFLTSHTEPEYVDRVKEITGYGYVVKDSGEFVLVESIEMALKLREAHRSTTEEKERYRSIIENTNDALFVHDFDGIITDVNGRAARLFGYSERELIGMSLERLHSPAATEKLRSLRAQGHVQDRFVIEQEMVTKDGQRIPVEVSAVVSSCDGNGEVQAFVRDMRLRKDAESAFNAVYDQTEEAIAMWDRDYRLAHINRAAARRLGGEPSEFRGLSLYDIHPKEAADRAVAGLRTVFETGRARTAEWHSRLHGEDRRYYVHSEPTIDESGQVTHVTTFSHDITELKRAEENYRLIAEHAHDVVAVFDGSFAPIYLSPSTERLFGYSLDDVSERGLFNLIHEDDVEELKEFIAESHARVETAGSYQVRVVDKGGATKWAAASATRLFGDDGRVQRVVVTAHDITAQKQMELALRRANARLEATLDALPDLFFELDGELRFRTFYAPNHEELYVPPREFIGKTAQEVLPPEVARRLEDAVDLATADRSPHTFDYSLPDEQRDRFFRASITARRDGAETIAVVIVHEVTDLVDARRRLESALERNERVLREMHHRVKNNLSLVSSLISLKNGVVSQVDLSDLHSQVDAVRFVHEQLQSVEDSDRIDFRTYVHDLLSRLLTSSPHGPVDLDIEQVERVYVDSTIAVPLGLIVNEIATNAVKHAFDGADVRRFTVTFSDRGSDYLLEVTNTGTPIPAEIDLENPTGLGLQLITGLAHQLHGSIELSRHPNTVFTIRFPKPAE
jgi:PAS domain S-box-containing protein